MRTIFCAPETRQFFWHNVINLGSIKGGIIVLLEQNREICVNQLVILIIIKYFEFRRIHSVQGGTQNQMSRCRVYKPKKSPAVHVVFEVT